MSRCYNCFQEWNNPDVRTCPHCDYDPATDQNKYPFALGHGSVLAGQYITGRVLGQGGFGITYLALDNQSGARVAIKEFMPESMAVRAAGTPQITVYTGQRQENFRYGMERFLDEAKVLAKFQDNPNIVGVRSYFEENGTAYFVMEYVEGISFKTYIQNEGGRVPWEEAVRILTPVMDALGSVHKEGIIHRDVTPDNIFLTADGQVKLLDFGSARYSLGDKSRSLDVVLKAGYAPKEQYTRRGKQGPYTDVYSLAACMYSAVTGYLPPESLDRADEDDLVLPSTRGIKIPQAVEDVILHGPEVQPSDRYQTMGEFHSALSKAVEKHAPDEDHIPVPLSAPVSVPPEKGKATQDKAVPHSDTGETPQDDGSDVKRTFRFPKWTWGAAACSAVVLCTLAVSGMFPNGKNAPINENSSADQSGIPPQYSVGDSSGDQPDNSIIALPPNSMIASGSQPEDNPDSSSSEPQVNNTKPGDTNNASSEIPEPSKTQSSDDPENKNPSVQDAPKPAESTPSQKDLQTKADTYAKSGDWENAAEQYRLMKTYGYLSGSALSKKLLQLGNSAQKARGSRDDANAVAALDLYQEAYRLGNMQAAVSIGRCYDDGIGVKRDEGTAVQYYIEAANAGIPDGMHNLGFCYMDGRVVEKNEELGVQWMTKSFEAGNVYSAYTLGITLQQAGQKELGFEWYLKGAQAGDVWCMENLGLCYQHGWGVEQDSEQEIYWLERFLKECSPAPWNKDDIQKRLNKLYEERGG